MKPKRGAEVIRPRLKTEYRIMFGTTEAVKGWTDLLATARANLQRAWDALATVPCPSPETDRQHRLRGRDLGTVTFDRVTYDQWQYEVTAGGRTFYVVDEKAKTVYLLLASPGHPKVTDR